MKYVLLYESADDLSTLAPAHFEDHWAWIQKFHNAGTLVMIGPFAEAQTQGAMAIFSTKDSAEMFAGDDPFVRNGVVRSWEVREWRDFDLDESDDESDDEPDGADGSGS